MTREEAIKRFENLLLHVDTDCVMGMETTEAINMAIKALEQPEIVRCKDCKYLLPKGSFCSKDMCGLRGMAHYRHVDIYNDFCSWGEVEDG